MSHISVALNRQIQDGLEKLPLTESVEFLSPRIFTIMLCTYYSLAVPWMHPMFRQALTQS